MGSGGGRRREAGRWEELERRHRLERLEESKRRLELDQRHESERRRELEREGGEVDTPRATSGREGER